MHESNGQAAIERFLHVKPWKTSRRNSINLYVGAVPTIWMLWGLYCLGGCGWTSACAAGIQGRIQIIVCMIESARYCIYLLEEGFKRTRWAIGCMKSWKSGVICTLCWQRDRPHRRHRTQRPDNPFRRSGDGHGRWEAYTYQLCHVGESLCDECGEDHLDS